MKFDLDIFCRVVVPFLTLIFGAWLSRFLEKRVRLIAYNVHAYSTEIKNPSGQPIRVNGHSIVILNSGKLAANNVRITHHTLPDFSVYPPANYTQINLPDGSKEIVIEKMIPGQQLTISYLYFPPLLWNQIHSGIKSDECFAEVINVIPSPQYPKWIINLLRILILVGIASLLYWSTCLLNSFSFFEQTKL